MLRPACNQGGEQHPGDPLEAVLEAAGEVVVMWAQFYHRHRAGNVKDCCCCCGLTCSNYATHTLTLSLSVPARGTSPRLASLLATTLGDHSLEPLTLREHLALQYVNCLVSAVVFVDAPHRVMWDCL